MWEQWVACDRCQAPDKPGLGRPQRLPSPSAFLSRGQKPTLSLLALQIHDLIGFGIFPGSLHCLPFQAQAFLSIHALVVAVTMRFYLLLLRRFARGGNPVRGFRIEAIK